jgi:vitamin B12 transporter
MSVSLHTPVSLPAIGCGLLLAVAALPPAAAAPPADPAQAPAETIIVTGTRLESPLDQVGTSISVITSEALERRGFQFVHDALATAPGVTINQNGAFGGVATVRIRGALSEQTLVLIDGVPVNDPTAPGGGYDFSRLDPTDIARIEILRGPQSTLWGSDAIGGVINVITRRPAVEDDIALSGFLEGGSFTSLRGGAALSGANTVGDYRVAVTGVRTQGISKADEADGNPERDGYDASTLNGRAGFNLPADARLEATLRRVEADTAIDGFGFDTGVADSDENTITEEFSATLRFTMPLLEKRLQLMALAGWSDIDRQSFLEGEPTFGFAGQRSILRTQATYTLAERHRLAAGIEREDIEADGQTTSLTSLFGLYELMPVESLVLSFGARVDEHDVYGAETTSRFAANWSIIDSVSLRGSWGQGFKAPTLFQTAFFCCGATTPNTDLRPETSEAFDVGVEWRPFGRGRVTLTYFEQDFDDLIDFSFVDGSYVNIAEATTRGVETAIGLSLTPLLGLNGSWSYIEARNGDGEPLSRVPEHSADVELVLTPTQRLTGSFAVRYNGEQADGFGTIERFTRVDVAARYVVNELFDVYARIENAFDTDYQQVFGYGTPGLSFFVGFRGRAGDR